MTVISVPQSLTLDDVAAMGEADEHHRYEMSAEGEVKIMMTATPEHARMVMQLVEWLIRAGYTSDQLRTDMGIYTGGGRQPDLTVWEHEAPDTGMVSVYTSVAGLAVVVEVISPGSRQNDLVDKVTEYAQAGIRRYWTVEQDGTRKVIMRTLDEDGRYRPAAPVTLAWLLGQPPASLLS
jgi:Uma2 family endonuclease